MTIYLALLMFMLTQDDKIKLDREWYKIPGGCTALVAVFLLGKLYIANAGDCRFANYYFSVSFSHLGYHSALHMCRSDLCVPMLALVYPEALVIFFEYIV